MGSFLTPHEACFQMQTSRPISPFPCCAFTPRHLCYTEMSAFTPVLFRFLILGSHRCSPLCASYLPSLKARPIFLLSHPPSFPRPLRLQPKPQRHRWLLLGVSPRAADHPVRGAAVALDGAERIHTGLPDARGQLAGQGRAGVLQREDARAFWAHGQGVRGMGLLPAAAYAGGNALVCAVHDRRVDWLSSRVSSCERKQKVLPTDKATLEVLHGEFTPRQARPSRHKMGLVLSGCPGQRNWV